MLTMPHTINLVSQFEDIIRRGGNELENNLASTIRPRWVHRSGSKKKVIRQKSFPSERDESPPPIPKRAPIISKIKGSADVREKINHSKNYGVFTDETPQFEYSDEGNVAFTSINDNEVFIHNNKYLMDDKIIYIVITVQFLLSL